MDKLVWHLRHLPADGVRLPNGLALRLSRGNGTVVLGCSRVGVPPSENEMKTVAEAVAATFGPDVIFRTKRPGLLHANGTGHWIWRLYWPLEDVEVCWRPTRQQPLFKEEQR